ncbi:PREDICTED: serine/threonine-protein phosphatase 6 regulatory ankyrin repeat subunit B-like [Ipomoea nil]|uniref:serine/threonine-protein phosphatase 6 regulatory ankyrin repeat subunit B-like n=1 Tax=Ipomoea nil TaxID=35883 RepID=UPI000901217D|nr:PREDICTED: serine/threonine-protein phosphatase 6 regulatory ankyrin repeat subunit B-like [Ipomoea nil]
MVKLVEVVDQEIRIDFALGSKCRATVTLRSLTAAAPVAFKVQTSSPHKFLVNPPSGLVPPFRSATFQVILKPQYELPATFPRSPSDRFLIRTALASDLNSVSPESTHSEFIHSWFNKTPHASIHDVKLKVAFVGPFLLQHAVMVGDCEAVRGIVRKQRSVLSALPTGEAESLVRVATQLDNSDEMVDLLLEAGLKGGAGLNNVRFTAKGWTALHIAAAHNRTDEIEKLVRGNASGSLDCRDKEGKTPLFLAASKGHLGPAKVLASAGAQVDTRSIDGRTALYRAVVNGDYQMVQMLIEMGADPTVTDNLGHSPIDVARDKGHEGIVKIVERGEQVVQAARRGELRLLESLLEKGAITTFCDQYGLTALHVAAIKGMKDAVMILVDFGADIECHDAGGHTPLHLAVEGGCAQTVEVLINRGADVNATNIKGLTPLSIARLFNYEDISQLLNQCNNAA